MAWTPKYDALFIGPLIENVITIIKRDEAEALAWANGGTSLPGFATHQQARRADVRYPFLAVLANETDLEESEEEAFLEEESKLIVEVALVNADPNLLAATLFRYVQALDSIIRSASPEDLAAGMAPTGHSRIKPAVRKHRYGLSKQLVNNQYLQVAQLEATFKYKEV